MEPVINKTTGSCSIISHMVLVDPETKPAGQGVHRIIAFEIASVLAGQGTQEFI